MDRVFERWRDAGLIWLPEYGVGFYPVAGAPYDEAYFAKYVEYAQTPLGRELTRIRVELVAKYAAGVDLVDVGIGCGAFIEARGGRTYGFDINVAAVRWLEEHGLFLDPYRMKITAATFWDSLEHIADADELLAHVEEWVFCSLPIVPGNGPPPLDWKHLRRDEHCWYWTREGFIAWMREHGFRCVEHNTAESLAGRDDVSTFVFRREANP